MGSTGASESSEVHLKWLIEDAARHAQWNKVEARLESHPNEASHVDSNSGRTILHQLCATTGSPEDIFRRVLDLSPESATIQEGTYLATPLHLLCWTSFQSPGRVKILLEKMSAEDVLIRNRFGGTALHSACGVNACFAIIQQLVEKNPQLLRQRTHDSNHTALTALWHSHLQTIPGHMALARILAGEDVRETHFERFWEKVTYLACESFKLSSRFPAKLDDSTDKFLIHGLLELRAPFNLMRVAIKRNKEWTRHRDANGDTILHLILKYRPYRARDTEIINDLVSTFPEAGKIRNIDGENPLHVGLRERIPWDDGLAAIADAQPLCALQRENSSGLYPFLYAASQGGRPAVNSCFQLLLMHPDFVQEASRSREDNFDRVSQFCMKK